METRNVFFVFGWNWYFTDFLLVKVSRTIKFKVNGWGGSAAVLGGWGMNIFFIKDR